MSLYAIKDEDGTYLRDDGDLGNDQVINFNDHASAKSAKNFHGGHVVELVEKAEPVEVSVADGEVLHEAKQAANPMHYIYANSREGSEYSLMHAYVIGWTVVKPKQYVLPMDDTSDGELAGYAYRTPDGVWNIDFYGSNQDAADNGFSVTQADIDAAPAWVKAIKPVEVEE